MFGPVAEGKDFNANALGKKYTSLGVAFTCIDNKKKALISTLTSAQFNACVVFGVGSGGVDKGILDPEVQAVVLEWVKSGGRLVIHGERSAEEVFKVFGKNWAFKGDYYRRTGHVLNDGPASSLGLAPPLCAKLPRSYNVKACMVSDVDDNDRLYSPEEGAVSHSLVPFFGGTSVDADKCPVAASSVGEGRLVFIGDVNAEAATMDIIALLTVL